MISWRLLVTGRVQGVGFRPHVYRLAREMGITGWVRNRPEGGVEILAQGDDLGDFASCLLDCAPPLARPRLEEIAALDHPPITGFAILESAGGGDSRVYLPPDQFACDDCLREMNDPADRRYRYPFINCTQCGPRYTIIQRLPYDRVHTAMAGFPLCPACRDEFADPGDRRFHAQPLACPDCGPRVRFGEMTGEAALMACLALLRAGGLVAVKGIGGYHLLGDARDEGVVTRLRQRKSRPHKPLAVLFPRQGGDGLAAVRAACDPSLAEAAWLADPMRPIVLVKHRGGLAPGLAPGLSELGVMLPHSPLHDLLASGFGAPLIATSANLSGEPVLTSGEEVAGRLSQVADGFLHHDRPILHPADDPVYRVIAGVPRPLRLGRGNAPCALDLPFRLPEPVMALGGELKNCVALAWDDRIVLSPHIGDLATPRGLGLLEQTVAMLQEVHGVRCRVFLADAHPGFAAWRWARGQGLAVHPVFHHHAHAAAVAGEFPEGGRWLVFTWDGVGYGEDGTLWGGEALLGRPGAWQRVGSFRTLALPGGDQATRHPDRIAAGLCWEAGLRTLDPLLHLAWQRGPRTSAVGRLCDAAAALLGVVGEATFEGHGPMLLEALAESGREDSHPALPLMADAQGVARADWSPLLPMLLNRDTSPADRAATLHGILARTLLAQARAARACHGAFTVGLAGGVFQNRLLTERVGELLAADGFMVRIPGQIPLNDAGLGFGQVVEFHGVGRHGMPED